VQAPLLLHAFSTFAVGGPQVRFATIANHFGDRYRHAIVAMDGNLAARERLDPALDVSYPAIDLPKGATLGNARRIRAALATMRPDALFTSNWGTIEWAIANRVRLVRHVHVEDGFGPEERDTQLPRRVLMRRLFLRGRTVVVPSLVLQRIATEVWRLDPARVRYLPNGVDLARFDGLISSVGPGAGPVIGTVAALRPEKNIARLIHAFAQARTHRVARLVIVGDGPERPALEQLAANLGIAADVHFAGHTPDPAALICGFDVFAMSSDTEQMPISLLEAMAARRPVAATDVGDIRAILPPEQSPYVVPCQATALGSALARLLDDPAGRITLGAANRAKAAQAYALETMLDGWDALFRGAPEGPSS
jgi:glycosyltransferase involved in cell wall biosynthesis